MAGSSNCDRDADSIEILSNPSQSSIGIIDSIQSSRKHSEERRLSQTEGLDVTASEYINNLQILNGAAQAILVNQQTSTLDLADTSVVSHTDDGAEREKKTGLSGVHLTESSSSGSVTDGSICTAYEQAHSDANNSEVSSNKTTSPVNEKLHRNDSSLSTMLGGEYWGFYFIIRKTKMFGVVIVYHSLALVRSFVIRYWYYFAFTKKKIKNFFSSIQLGLFQSTNLLLSKTAKDNNQVPPCDKFRFSYTDFENVDHRFKLFLYQNIFEDVGEHMKWIVKGKIFNDNNISSTDTAAIIDGIFVMSTTKFYVLQIVGNER